ncbi:MAG: ferredoxin--NADP reductase [Thermoanaerobaculales bacterium]|jgi:ferredoxin--NADP+ reductase|nr:ferredoxin--NADP reductase [Thermoanaerobaculales bacterium]
MAKTELNAVVLQRVEVAPGLIILRVVPEGWELPDFKPGQFAVLGLPPEAPRSLEADPDEDIPPKPGAMIRRSYSIASSSKAREYLELYITLVRSGSLTPRLFALGAGDRLWLGPRITGFFTLDAVPADSHLVLVATGTGLAPYMSMLRTMLPAAGGRRIAVVLGARHSWDLGYQSELRTLERRCPGFAYLPVISRPAEEPLPWGGPAGYVQDLWREGAVARAWGFAPTPATTAVFLCGNPAMIDDMVGLLAAQGFREHSRREPGQVFVERYW